MTVIYHDLIHKENIAFMKGAPERVLEACTYDSENNPLTETAKSEVLRLMDRFASEGLVVSCVES
jgi:magnesium-transporting ATPase (P-type)